MIRNFIKLVRWPNLLIVFVTQCVVWFHLVNNALELKNLTSNLNLFQFLLLSLCTMIVAAAGYIINDIKDVKIDLINKPDKVIVGKFISVKTCYLFYYLLLGLGLLLAIALGWKLNKLPFVILFPMAAGCLHAYATTFKKSNLIGNILISCFVAAVPIIIFLADAEYFSFADDTRLYYILLLYALLAFLANLAREIVKDMQDVKGDKSFKASTFPIRFGFQKTRYLIYSILSSLLFILGYWTFIYDFTNQSNLSIGLGTIPLLTIALALMISLSSFNTPDDLGKWSLGIKLFMLFGLIFLYLQPL